ncbi:Threonine/homoserine efflux transporter RhtA [Stigmatella aurantiaca]|uniref:Threonine/homoserine efflux transporter RhtA n=1 Tax=Stigmatella aurantiaca TaxID=41 RepID=A0A1H7UI44_STIAU|nr:DMT family transporter [Stigmatella aurantiaca]SEL96489.1 Threonine/homoserine efflux transporter RhtA [Stigmatella aurantiaca]
MKGFSVPERWRGLPLLMFSSFLFALMALFARMLSGRLSVGQVVCGRFAVGLVFLALYYPVMGHRPRFGRPLLWSLRGIFGGISVYLYFVCIDLVAVGPAVLLNACWPIYGAILGYYFLKEQVSGPLLGGLVLTTVGAGLVIWGTSMVTSSLSFGLGAWAGMFSAVFSGAAVVALRALRNDTDPATVFLSFCVFGLLFGLPFALADWRPLAADTVGLLLAVGLSSAVAQMIFTYAMGHVTTAMGGVGSQLTPVFSWLLGAVFLTEPVAPLALLGAALCILGVLWGTGLLRKLLAPAAVQP